MVNFGFFRMELHSIFCANKVEIDFEIETAAGTSAAENIESTASAEKLVFY